MMFKAHYTEYGVEITCMINITATVSNLIKIKDKTLFATN